MKTPSSGRLFHISVTDSEKLLVFAKVNGELDGHGSRRIRSSSSDAATARADAGETDLCPSDDASSAQPRRISDPVCHAASSSAEPTTHVLGHVTHEVAGSIGATARPAAQQHISDQRRRLATEEVRA